MTRLCRDCALFPTGRCDAPVTHRRHGRETLARVAKILAAHATKPPGFYAPVPEFPGYLAGQDGGIYSTRGWRGVPVGIPARLAENIDSNGYSEVATSVPGKRKGQPVHRMVAMALLPPCPSPEHQVRHLDGSRTNSAPSNLAWGTPKENAADKHRHGTTVRGSKHVLARLTEDHVLAIRNSGKTTDRELAQRFGVAVATISHVRRGMAWQHVGGPTRGPAFRRPPTSPDVVIKIREARASGASLERVASLFGVSPSQVRNIVYGRAWPKVAGPIELRAK